MSSVYLVTYHIYNVNLYYCVVKSEAVLNITLLRNKYAMKFARTKQSSYLCVIITQWKQI